MPIADQKHMSEYALHVVDEHISAEWDAVTNTVQTAAQRWFVNNSRNAVRRVLYDSPRIADDDRRERLFV